jgi:uncharacterized protein with PIN domain
VKFVVDNMLGKLARYLRILGYDAIYLPQRSPDNRLQLDLPDRILLTRNTRYKGQHPNQKVIFIPSEKIKEQLAFLINELPIEISSEKLFSRCLDCNVPVNPIPKSAAQGKVPEKSYNFYTDFSRCPNCGKIYWRGTHTERVLRMLKTITQQHEP